MTRKATLDAAPDLGPLLRKLTVIEERMMLTTGPMNGRNSDERIRELFARAIRIGLRLADHSLEHGEILEHTRELRVIAREIEALDRFELETPEGFKLLELASPLVN